MTSELNTQYDDACSYERQLRRQSWLLRRHQLLLGVWLTCSGFTWPGRVPHLSYQAAHGSVPERVEGLRLLEEYPSQASGDACLAGLEDRATEVRAQAAQCVGAAGDERATTNLLDLASAKDPAERAAALEAIGCLAPARALSSIEQALTDPDPLVRAAAARALVAYGAARSLDAAKAEALLRSELVDVRLAAVELLGAGFEQAKAPPMAAASSGSQGPRASAVSVQPSRSALQLRAALRDGSAEVRAAATRALGRARSTKLLPDLTAAVSDADETVRLSAIAALGDSKLAAATPALRALSTAKITQASQLRAARTALAALGRIDDESALSAIAAALPRPELTQSAAQALTARARRIDKPESFRRSAEALQRAIDATRSARVADSMQTPAGAPSTSDASLDALARAALELAPYCDVQPALTSLTQALAAGRGDAYSLTQHLIAPAALAHAAEAKLLSALLERDPKASPRLAEAIIAVLESSGDAPALIAAHSAQLQKLSAAQPTDAQLHALLQMDDTPATRRALAQLWAKQPALAVTREHLERLVRWLDDPDKETREHSSVALARAADTAALEALATRLERAAPHPVLTLQASAGTVLRVGAQLPSALRERLLRQFQAYLNMPDEAVAMSALFALRASRDQRSALWIAGVLRGSSAPLRAAAVQALAGFEQPEARRMLRDMLRSDNQQNASNAALALAELGSDRDVEALLRAAERGSWPLPPAAAYAASRITARGATRKHSLERVLCRFAQLRDSYVLSNIVSALAALGADACDEHIDPKHLLDPVLPSALRVSAALWLQNTRPHTPEESAERSALLSRCAADHDAAVASACTPHAPLVERTGQTLLRVVEADQRSPLKHRLVALRMPDASVFIGPSDGTGHVLLPRVVAGEIVLEDPADQGPIALPVRSASAASP